MMPIYTIETPEGRRLKIEAADETTAIRGAQEWSASQAPAYVQPEPPAGEIIHGAKGSYVTGRDDLSVNTEGMAPADRNMASAALAGRRDAPMSRGLMPTFQGVSSSWGDEAVSGMYGLAAGAQGGNVGDAYNYAQEVQRQELDQERKENPIRSTIGQIAGGLTLAPALATAAGPAMAGTSLGARMGAGAAAGAGYGALEGAGAGSGLQGRSVGAGVGAGAGAVLGAAAPALGSAIKSGANRILDSRTVNQNLKALGINRTAGDSVMRALDADDAAGAGARRLAAAGDDAMLADAGPATRSALDTAMQQGGPAMRIAGDAVEARATAANSQMTRALDDAFGAPLGVATTSRNVRETARPVLKQVYDTAYKLPIDYSSPDAMRLESLLKRVPAKALQEANDFMGLTGHRSKQILADIADDGTISYRTLPDVLQVDHITRGLNQLAKSGDGQGALGGQTPKGAVYENLSREIRRTLRKLVPEYGTALDTAADPIQEISALKLGRDILKPSMARDEVAMAIDGMSEAELRGVRQGVRSQIDEVLANVKAVASDPNLDAREANRALRELSSRAVREKVETVLGNKTKSAILMRELDRAAKALELRAGTAQNSRTFGRQVVAEAIKDAQEPGMVGAAMRGKPIDATQRGVQAFFGTRPQDFQAQRDEIYAQIAQVLTGPRGPKAKAALDELVKAYNAIPKNAQNAQMIGDNVAAATGISSIPQAREAGQRALGMSGQRKPLQIDVPWGGPRR
jgi:hypothetical protein